MTLAVIVDNIGLDDSVVQLSISQLFMAGLDLCSEDFGRASAFF